MNMYFKIVMYNLIHGCVISKALDYKMPEGGGK